MKDHAEKYGKLGLRCLRVMLAPNRAVETSELPNYPYLASYKLDGMRATVYPLRDVNGDLTGRSAFFSRSAKMLRPLIHTKWEKFLQEAHRCGMVFDGELYSEELEFSELMSVLKKTGRDIPDHVKFHVFDAMTVSEWENGTERPFIERYDEYRRWVVAYKMREGVLDRGDVRSLRQFKVRSPEALGKFIDGSLEMGYEGAIVRDPVSQYKHGRGTILEDIIYKFKEWVTLDAKVVGFKKATRMRTEYAKSERGEDELGRTIRTSAKATREEYDAIGSVELETSDGTRFLAGFHRDFDGVMEWEFREGYIGEWVEVRFMKHGAKDKPRFAGITRWRPDIADAESIEGLGSVLAG